MQPGDPYRAARLLVGRYGPDAGIHVVMRIDALAQAGDEARIRLWTIVLAAIDELQRTERRPDEAYH